MTKGTEPSGFRELGKDDVSELYAMLTYKRPHCDPVEEEFLERFLLPLGVKQDAFGNLYKRIGENSPVAWSCHTDTVHRKGGKQHVAINDKYVVKLAAKEKVSNCLGADDTAGVWLMVQMIKSKVPGLYMFHRGEEVGCQGSRWVAKTAPGILVGTKFVIALDRRDKDNIITFQSGNRCCSDDFAKSLGDQLGMGYKADPSGMFTDSASYVDLVGECTNLSVGYFNQHGFNESLDVVHLCDLYKALAKVDAAKLVSKRKPGEKESRWASSYSESNWHGGGSYRRGAADFNSNKWRIDYYSESYQQYIVTDKDTLRHATHAEWEKWRTKVLLAKLATTKAKPAVQDNVPPELPPLIELIKGSVAQVASMFLQWGFDAPMLRESLLENMFHAKDETEDKSTVKSEATVTAPNPTLLTWEQDLENPAGDPPLVH